MSLGKFLKSKKFFRHLGLILLSFLVLLIIAFQLLKVYTRHGKEYIVPDIEGMNIEEAIALTEMSPFQVIELSSIFVHGEEAGKIIKQDPIAESKAKKGRKIYLITTSETGEKISMPDCKDQSVRSAVNLIVNSGLRIQKLSIRVGTFSNLVVDQRYKNRSIVPGTKIEMGEEIELVVEISESTTMTTVPNILGLTEAEAEKRLWESTLNVGRKDYEGKKDVSRSRVVGYSPAYESLDIGSVVNISLVNDTKPNYKRRLNSFRVRKPVVVEDDYEESLYD